MVLRKVGYTERLSHFILLLLFTISTKFAVTIAQTANLDTLELVQVLFRHGARTPEYAYENDPYQDESNWPEGWGQLTEEGKMQEYELGKYLRSRYDTFLSEKYVANEIYVLSSDLDRTIMSAEICLAGLYPTNNSTDNWNPDVNWQPIPLHTIQTEHDNIIRMKRPCPRFDEMFQDFIHNSDLMKKINTDNAKLFQDLSKNSGENITTIMGIDDFYATLMVEKMNNLTLPDWTTPLFTDNHFQYLYNLSFAAKTYTPELQRLRTGGLLAELRDNINKTVSRSNSSEWKTKFVMFSGHDITILDLLNTFGVLDLQLPHYASSVMMELHRDFNNATNKEEYFFNIYYRNDSSRDPYQLVLPNCTFNCPLETVLNKFKPIIPDNWETECQHLAQLHDFSWLAILAIGAASCIIICVLISLVATLCKKMRQNKEIRRGYQQY